MEPENITNNACSPTLQPQKFSRYRSVRAKSATTQTAQPLQQQASLAKTPSRYHRKNDIKNAPPLPTQVHPPVEKIETHQSSHNKSARSPILTQQLYSDETNGFYTTLEQPLLVRARPGSRKDQPQSQTTASRPTTSTEPWSAAREEARMILEGEFDRLQNLKKQQEKQQQLLPGSEAPDLTKKRDRQLHVTKNHKTGERERQKLINQSPDINKRLNPHFETPTNVSSKMRTLVIGGRTKKEVTQEEPKQVPTLLGARAKQRQSSPQRAHQFPQIGTDHQPDTVRAFDAPVSAVNAGDRRVEIKCNQASITLPVTLSTTVKDLLNSASLCMSESIDPKTAVLLESFSKLGLERPLRRYERIRDVMNSWDTDIQNHLVVLAASECGAVGLERDQAPAAQPDDTNIQIYHSPKPGKWDKLWVKLRKDGQVSVSKHENSKDSTNICHLSDFDLYTPTRKQAKKVKAPKKICIAIKSQQKSAMFLQGLNFVHFFCTNDKNVADQWYKAVQSWRSWYLISVMGEGQKKPEPVQELQQLGTTQSQDSIPYQLGSFKPLLDIGDIRRSSDSSGEPNSLRASLQSMNRRQSMRKPSFEVGPGRPSLDVRLSRTQGPPSSFPQRMIRSSIEVGPGDMEEAQLFTGGSLLARSASKRSQSGHASGRGILGSKGKPLVDLAPTSEFTDGSLLRKMEALTAENGTVEPKIDREKRFETIVPVGEGYN